MSHPLASELGLGFGHLQPGNQISELRNKGLKRGILVFSFVSL